MYKIKITSNDIQEQSFTLYGMNLKLTLYYNKVLTGYQFDLFNLDTNRYITKMKGLSVSSPSLIEFNLPFVFVLYDKSALGIGSISKSDFSSRFELLIMTKDEYREAIWQGYTA